MDAMTIVVRKLVFEYDAFRVAQVDFVGYTWYNVSCIHTKWYIMQLEWKGGYFDTSDATDFSVKILYTTFTPRDTEFLWVSKLV